MQPLDGFSLLKKEIKEYIKHNEMSFPCDFFYIDDIDNQKYKITVEAILEDSNINYLRNP